MIYVFLLLAEGVNSLCLNSTPTPNTTKQAMNLKHMNKTSLQAPAKNKGFGKCTAKQYSKSTVRVQQKKRLFEKS